MQRSLTDYFNMPLSCVSSGRINISSPNSSMIKRKRKSRTSDKENLHQTIIDAGQKKIGLHHCVKCGMVYNVDDKNDIVHHDEFHNRFTSKKCYRVTVTQLHTWKTSLYWEHVQSPIGGIFFRLSGNSVATLRRKFEDIVKNFVNEEIGYCSDLAIWDIERTRQALIFIAYSATKDEAPFIGGILLVDSVRTATLMPEKKHFQGQFLSVNRIWVHTELRRRKLATFLLDTACRLMSNCSSNLPRTRVAFSDPTDAGIQLAQSFIDNGRSGRYITYLSYPTLYHNSEKC